MFLFATKICYFRAGIWLINSMNIGVVLALFLSDYNVLICLLFQVEIKFFFAFLFHVLPLSTHAHCLSDRQPRELHGKFKN